jgi:hypothetical protein
MRAEAGANEGQISFYASFKVFDFMVGELAWRTPVGLLRASQARLMGKPTVFGASIQKKPIFLAEEKNWKLKGIESNPFAPSPGSKRKLKAKDCDSEMKYH